MPPITVAHASDKPNHPHKDAPHEDQRRKTVQERPRRADRKDGRNRHLRHWVQIAVFAITVAAGIQFAGFVHQASNISPVTIQRPPGVEGFLPIGGLMGWKLFFTSGVWDPMHPAAMVVLGFAALICWAWRKSFCAWICPVGTLSEWLWRLGRKWVGRNFRLPKWFDMVLRSVKYALLGFFVWVIFQMDARRSGPGHRIGLHRVDLYGPHHRPLAEPAPIGRIPAPAPTHRFAPDDPSVD